jgi:hypothetical protein
MLADCRFGVPGEWDATGTECLKSTPDLRTLRDPMLNRETRTSAL